MKKLISLLVVVLAATFTSCKDEHSNLADGLYAEIETSKGNILVKLNYEKAPVTVANFVALAEGNNPFVSPELKGKHLFDGLKFHRVISKTNGDADDFMIQGGDPLGNGSGDAGYKFKDEITDLKFDKGGILAMANSGPGTNGSQFFITIVPTPWLDGKHTIFGEVIENGMEVVNSIKVNDGINSIKIIRKGETVKKFDAVKIFSDSFKVEAENQKKQAEIEAENQKQYKAKYQKVITNKLASFASAKASATKTPTGLMYAITKKGCGKKPAAGSTVFIKYAGFLEDGTLFDTSNAEVAKTFGKYDAQRDAQKQYTGLPFEIGTKTGVIPGFIEGIEKLNLGDKAVLFIPSNLAYGPNGAGDLIPPNANIIFEIEVSDKM